MLGDDADDVGGGDRRIERRRLADDRDGDDLAVIRLGKARGRAECDGSGSGQPYGFEQFHGVPPIGSHILLQENIQHY
jgi:hypothetical protein